MRVLTFEQIVDDRFDNDIKNLIEKRVKLLTKKLLSIENLYVTNSGIYEVNFSDNIQYRCRFYIYKTTRQVTWNDIYGIVNSVKPCCYEFKNCDDISINKDKSFAMVYKG